MAKVLNKMSINGSVMKMIEIGDEYIINGQLYDKNSFVPKPLQIAPIYGTAKFECSFYRKLYIEQTWNLNRSDRTFVIDKNDPNIIWLCVSHPYATSKIIKVDKKNTGIEITETNSYASANNIEILSQDNDRLYLLEHNIASPYTNISTINKTTMIRDFTYSTGLGRYKMISENNTFIYVAGHTWVGGKNTFRIHKYNKFTGVGSIVHEDADNTAKNTVCLGSNMEPDGSMYVVKNNKPVSNVDEICIKKYKLNVSNDVVEKSTLSIDWKSYLPASIPVIEDAYEISYEVFIVNDTDARYLNVIRYNNGNGTVTLSPDRCSIYTFKILSNGNLEFVIETKLAPNIFNGVMPMYNNKLLLLVNGNGVQFFNWDSSSKQYKNTTGFNYPTRMVGIDMNNNIWIQQQDSSVDVLANTLPIQISADFVLQDYDYRGVDINTAVEVEASNFLGEFITSDLELTLIGPVKFVSNNSKKIMVTTSPTGKLNIPVIITGPGTVRVNTKYFS